MLRSFSVVGHLIPARSDLQMPPCLAQIGARDESPIFLFNILSDGEVEFKDSAGDRPVLPWRFFSFRQFWKFVMTKLRQAI